jgi:hypothetical protein
MTQISTQKPQICNSRICRALGSARYASVLQWTCRALRESETAQRLPEGPTACGKKEERSGVDEEGKCHNFAYLRPPQKPQYDLQIALVPGNSASHFSFVNPFCRSVLHPKWHCNPVSQPSIHSCHSPSSTKHLPYAHPPPYIPQTPTLVR